MTSSSADTLCPGCFAAKWQANPCPHCGYDEQAERGPLILPHRTPLRGQYLVGRVLGKPGGVGITYLGWDLHLDARVAIKEYLPRDLAGRSTDGKSLALHSPEDGDLFRLGLDQFLREARTLAQLDHPNIVRVRDFFEANATAYLVMDYYQGLSLAEHLEHQPGRVREDVVKRLLLPILSGLHRVHARGLLHRNIKPASIYLARTDSGGVRPILLGFGVTRQATGGGSRAQPGLGSAGYAPFEQYQRQGSQGPWTDIYSVAAVLYRLVTGEAPPDATERMSHDEIKPAARFGVSPGLSDALSAALALTPESRPQTIQRFQALLLGATQRAEPPAPVVAPVRPPVPAPVPPATPPSLLLASPKARKASAAPAGAHAIQRRRWWPAALAMALVVLGLGTWYHDHQMRVRQPVNDRTVAVPRGTDADLKDKAREADLAAYDAATKASTVEAYEAYLAGCVRKACAKRAEAQTMLGVRYAEGRGVARDERQAAEWYRKAAEQGYALGQIALGSMYQGGRGVELDYRQAVKWYRAAAEQGDAAGQSLLGLMYEAGLGVERDEPQAAQWYRNAAEQGNGVAQNRLGVMYEMGLGVERDERQALQWCRRAAEQGNADGQLELGARYARGLGVEQDDQQAVHWYRKAAEQGNALGQIALGAMYRVGRGVGRDDRQAVQWYLKAAEQGSAEGQFVLAGMYAKGLGVERDDRQAVTWCRKAAEQGHADAQFRLGLMYVMGLGVDEDDRQAALWSRKAAEHGNANGQYMLGMMYWGGRGVEQDDQQAVLWFRKAAEQGNASAQEALDRMKREGRK